MDGQLGYPEFSNLYCTELSEMFSSVESGFLNTIMEGQLSQLAYIFSGKNI